MLFNFQFYIPVKIIFGCGSVTKVGQEVKFLEKKKAFVVTDEVLLKKTDIVERVKRSLESASIDYVVYSDVEPNPTVEKTDKSADVARKEKCDVIVGVGGGSPLDVAKSVAVTVAHGGTVWDYIETGVKGIPGITSKTLPIIAVPTTAGTGSETTRYAVIMDTKTKIKSTVVSKYIFPKVAIVDPELTVTMPPRLTVITGLDALCHAIEGYTSRFAQPMTDMIAIESMKLIQKYLRLAVADGNNIEARAGMMWASTLAGMVIAETGCTVAHAISHCVTAHYGIDHGLASILVTPASIRYCLIGNMEKFANIASLLGENINNLSTREAALKSIDAVKKLMADIGVTQSLKDLGVKEEGIPKLAEDTMTMGALNCSCRKATLNEIINVLKEAITERSV